MKKIVTLVFADRIDTIFSDKPIKQILNNTVEFVDGSFIDCDRRIFEFVGPEDSYEIKSTPLPKDFDWMDVFQKEGIEIISEHVPSSIIYDVFGHGTSSQHFR